ncbi:hypothetical protein NITGR_1000002 [Nitrospina gracilis 3/211]|uniref:Cell division protein ZapB n=1 Tax=Nitrospina gracilis (strain 3/211) TaxID=1266370 RepID=M1Z8D2_NITG3|nr:MULTISPECIES: hypothetical protein [Nitrospina]MCF8722085.1 putative nucleic acid-binding Zn-ribbon protein [Nitrospina sp. Nb-3]CCQ89274.1 hypothetical protein NITGR_1000002 [Nitrospina gracilis 3/211]
MSTYPVDKLEHLVSEWIETARALREENVRLQTEIRQLRQQVESLSQQQNGTQVKLNRLASLEAEQKRWEEERKTMRTKVRGILEQLHRIPAE